MLHSRPWVENSGVPKVRLIAGCNFGTMPDCHASIRLSQSAWGWRVITTTGSNQSEDFNQPGTVDAGLGFQSSETILLSSRNAITSLQANQRSL